MFLNFLTIVTNLYVFRKKLKLVSRIIANYKSFPIEPTYPDDLVLGKPKNIRLT